MAQTIETWRPPGDSSTLWQILSGGGPTPSGDGWSISNYEMGQVAFGKGWQNVKIPVYQRVVGQAAPPAPAPTAPTQPTTPSYTPTPAVKDNFDPNYVPKPAVDPVADKASKDLTNSIINNVKPPDTSQLEAQLKALQNQLTTQQTESQRNQLAITTQLQDQLKSQQEEAARQQQALTQQFQSLLGGQQQQFSNNQLAIQNDYQSQLANVQKSQQQLMAALDQDYRNQMLALQSTYEGKLGSTEKSYQDQLGILNSQISNLSNREKEYQNQIGSMQRSYQDQIGSLQRSYQDQIGSLNSRIVEMNNTRNQDGWRAKAAMQIGSRGADAVQTDQYAGPKGTEKLNRSYMMNRSSSGGNDMLSNLLINQNMGIGGINPMLIGGVNL